MIWCILSEVIVNSKEGSLTYLFLQCALSGSYACSNSTFRRIYLIFCFFKNMSVALCF